MQHGNSHDVVAHCFKVCMISSSTDGSDDGFTHSLKPGRVTHSAVEAITTETVLLNSRDCDDDLFASDREAEFEANLQGAVTMTNHWLLNFTTNIYFCYQEVRTLDTDQDAR